MTTSTTPTGYDILAVPMQPNDADARTIADYLVELLATLWTQQANFNAKRPFGDSGWAYDLYEALGRAGMIRIEFDEDDVLEDCDTNAGDRLITLAISALADAVPAGGDQ